MTTRGRTALAILALAVALGALGMVAEHLGREPDPLALAPRARTADVGAEHATEPVPHLPIVPTLPPDVRLRRAHGEGASADDEAADLSSEMRLVSEAREVFRGGEPAIALSLLDQHRERFPSGALAEEREAYAIRALRALGRDDEAERRLTDFFAEHPGSRLLDD